MRLSLNAVLDSACRKISVVSLVSMALVTFVDVTGRVLLNAPLGFAYELVGILLAVCFYAGLYHVSATRKHITIDLFDKHLSGRVGLAVAWFSYLCEVLFFACVVVMVTWQAQQLYQYGEVFMFLDLEKWRVLAGVAVLAWIALLSVLTTSPDYRSYQEPEGAGQADAHPAVVTAAKGGLAR